jgi:hypothetical protein
MEASDGHVTRRRRINVERGRARSNHRTLKAYGGECLPKSEQVVQSFTDSFPYGKRELATSGNQGQVSE